MSIIAPCPGLTVGVEHRRDRQAEIVRAQSLCEPSAPFDDSDRLLQLRIEIQIPEFFRVGEPVGVHMHERRAITERRMLPRNDERR